MNCHTEPRTNQLLVELMEYARACVRLVEPKDAVPMLDQWLVIDVREPAETLHGYLPFAISVPRGQLEFELTETPNFDTTRPVLVYSNSGRRSLLAGLSLVNLGFPDVGSLSGGINRWKDLGMPLE